jgi:Epoxide hydrolase N terminus
LTRWPDDVGNEDWHYGVNRGYLQELVEYWRTGYDWRGAEAEINAYEHYRVEGVPVHFMRRAEVGPEPMPLILSIRTYANNNRYPWDPLPRPVAGRRGAHRHHLRRPRHPVGAPRPVGGRPPADLAGRR